jgi:hypothetical protein
MQKVRVLRSGVAAVAAMTAFVAVPVASASAAPKVSVRVEGRTTTLLAATTVQTKPGSITRGGAPAGSCPATSAQGALADATKGNWKGTWYSSYDEYYVTGILGLNETSSKYYWALYVNNAYASAGACDVKLKPGASLLFAVVPAKGKTEEVIGLEAPATATAGQAVTATVVYYDAKGKAHALAGATVQAGGKTLTSNAAGEVGPLSFDTAGAQTLLVSKPHYIRDEATIDVAGA